MIRVIYCFLFLIIAIFAGDVTILQYILRLKDCTLADRTFYAQFPKSSNLENITMGNLCFIVFSDTTNGTLMNTLLKHPNVVYIEVNQILSINDPTETVYADQTVTPTIKPSLFPTKKPTVIKIQTKRPTMKPTSRRPTNKPNSRRPTKRPTNKI